MAEPQTNSTSKTVINLMLLGSFFLLFLFNFIAFFFILRNYVHSLDYYLITINLLTLFYLTFFYFFLKQQRLRSTQIENEKKITEIYLKGVIENSPELISIIDTHYQYIIFNFAYQSKFIHLFGKTIFIGMHLDDALHDTATDYKTKILSNWKRALSGEKFSEIIALGKETFEITYSPIRNNNQDIIAAIEINKNISRLLQHENAARELNEKLAYEMQELGIQNEKMSLLIELTDIVQACATISEATKAIEMKCRKILHFAEGTLYISNSSDNQLEQVVTWGDPIAHAESISPDQCWALRKGHLYQIKNPQADLICEHIDENTAVPYMCVPLLAQNAVIGMLHLDFPSGSAGWSDENRILISAVTETLALAFANIKLRETLKTQSLHDPLTGLYNRRFFNEFILRALSSAARNKSPLALIMLDIDYFKNFNDEFGHDMGDMVLQELGKVLQNEIRASDIACRYGGEEFLCVLSDCSLECATGWANKLRIKISEISIRLASEKIENITLSIGIAMYPEDGMTAPILVDSADQALYQAKRTGRNKIVTYSELRNNLK